MIHAARRIVGGSVAVGMVIVGALGGDIRRESVLGRRRDVGQTPSEDRQAREQRNEFPETP